MRPVAVLALVFVAASCAARSAPRAPASTAPDPDVAILGNDCLACHTGDLIRQQRLTEKQWRKSLDKMRTWGAPTEDDEVEPLLAHLAATASRDAAPPARQTISADEAASLFVREADGGLAGGNAARGRALYADRCAPCHADDAKGSATGVALAGRKVLDRASAVAAVVRAGRGRMPDYADTTDAELADLLAYLRSLPAP